MKGILTTEGLRGYYKNHPNNLISTYHTFNFQMRSKVKLGNELITAPSQRKSSTGCREQTVHLKGKLRTWANYKAMLRHIIKKRQLLHSMKQWTSKYSVSGSNRRNKSSKNDTYMVSEVPLPLYMKLENWLLMWQLHLFNNFQNATYLKSETNIHLYPSFFHLLWY